MRISSRDLEASLEVGGGAGPVVDAPRVDDVGAVVPAAGVEVESAGLEDESAGLGAAEPPNIPVVGVAPDVAVVDEGVAAEEVALFPKMPVDGAGVEEAAGAAEVASSFF